MQTLKTAALVCCVALLAGPWTLSINPLDPEEMLTLAHDFVGSWENSDDTDDDTWAFLSESDSTGHLIIEEEGRSVGVFEARLVRLGGRLDLFVAVTTTPAITKRDRLRVMEAVIQSYKPLFNRRIGV